jgi:hypothetical protein
MEHPWSWGQWKCTVVNADIVDARPRLLALLEMKLSFTSRSKAATFLPSSLYSFLMVDANGSSGGILST